MVLDDKPLRQGNMTMTTTSTTVIREGHILAKVCRLDHEHRTFLVRQMSDGNIEFYSNDACSWLTASEDWRASIERLPLTNEVVVLVD